MAHPAVLFQVEEGGAVQCFLCSHFCLIAKGKRGFCGVRKNVEGKLQTLVYGDVVAANVDPIEKKPLNHFLPGSKSFSIATVGCNFKCSFCQNWQISQLDAASGSHGGYSMTPEQIVDEAVAHGCQSISYTYTEPTIFFEYAFDIAKEAHERGLKNIFVTNGYMSRNALDMINPYLDACNVDLKAFSEGFYQEFCKAQLKPVLDSIAYMHELGLWLEVTTLLIPNQNDDAAELQGLAEFIVSINKDIPWHISRYRPEYKYNDSPATPLDLLRSAKAIGKEAGLRYIYLGNVVEGNDTLCPDCDYKLIDRLGYSITTTMDGGAVCPECNAMIKGVFL